MRDLYDGLPDDVCKALACAPRDEKALLEISLAWRGLPAGEARIATRLRVFFLTWDPLGDLEDRGWAWATSSGDGDGFEAVLYVRLDKATHSAETTEIPLAEVLGVLGETVLLVGAQHEFLLRSGTHAGLAWAGKAPGLLSRPVEPLRFGIPAVQLAAPGWEPIGLGAIQDLAQEAFGPVDLDRTTVRLDAVLFAEDACPACSGRGFGFPADLDEQRAAMCPPHAEQARHVTSRRLAQAAESNRDGWRAIAQASERLEHPHVALPRELRDRLEEIGELWELAGRRSARELRAEAATAIELAELLVERARPLNALMDSCDWLVEEWLLNLPADLAEAGLVDDAVRVADALAEVDDHTRLHCVSEAALILTRSGRPDEARARAEALVHALPDSLAARLRAADVFASAKDASRAEPLYAQAFAIALAGTDPEDVDEAASLLANFLEGQPGRRADAHAVRRDAQEWARQRGWIMVEARPRFPVPAAPKVGRNERCPCGSGRKYKRCCGR